MAAISTAGVVAACGAVATALGALEVSKCVGQAFTSKDVQVSSDAVAEYIGQVKCSVRGSYFKTKRHITLLGDVLVVSHRPGNADAMVSVRGSDVTCEAAVVSVLSAAEGSPLLKFWLSSTEEAEEWAATLRSAAQSSMEVPKMLSLTRAQLEELKAKEGGSGFSIEQIEALEAGLTEKENELECLQKELDGFKEVPKMLSLSRRQMAELEATCSAKEERIAQLVAELEGRAETQSMAELTQKQIEEMEAQAAEKEGQVAALQEQLDGLQAVPKQLSLSRKQVASLEAQAAQKDKEVTDLQAKLETLEEVPKMLSVKRREVQELEVHTQEKEKQIAELQGQLDGLSEVSKMSLDDQQVKELQERTLSKEMELEVLKKHFAEEMSKRPVRYIGIPVAASLSPQVGSPTHMRAVPVRAPGMTRWGAQLQMARQRLPAAAATPTYAQKSAGARSMAAKAVGA